ncbi:helix-turn-helix transcriptional regulator [Actinoallomurus bryophytorum]|uniref:Helix-turn-helix protein n=1 Tax=Actinoallomurus bryophytorum TaxID=1490222 RepID=A0A543CLS8_9ACTN|nr:helix-turn-helix transcriptional regulator [Actinoallomurus bryophytorum]TQL98058.1 helix-turn-helix protein [Actinoallomurus bryophytorum]
MPQLSDDLTRDPLVRAFGALLRAHREAAGLGKTHLGDLLGCTGQWISMVENAVKPPSEAFAIDLDTYFKTPVNDFHCMWEELKRAGKHRLLPEGFPAFLQLESEATSIREYEALLVPGILQTEEYARDVLRSGQKPDALDQLVASRLERRAMLEREDPPRVWLLIDETVIRRNIGSGTTMRHQLETLIVVGERPNVTVQVVPSEAGSHPGLEGSFTILSFAGVTPDVGYIEGAGGHGILVEKVDRVLALEVRYDLIRAAALPESESLKLLASVMEAS